MNVSKAFFITLFYLCSCLYDYSFHSYCTACQVVITCKRGNMVNLPNSRLVIFLFIIGRLSQCWAEDGFRICFRETERSSQCQGPSYTCSGWSSNPAWTQSFRDDTDNRGGGCHYQWKIQAHHNIKSHRQYRLCFQETEGSSQCQGTRSSCTGWSHYASWTNYFRDDTDNRGGGCRYAWKLESRWAPFSHIQRELSVPGQPPKLQSVELERKQKWRLDKAISR